MRIKNQLMTVISIWSSWRHTKAQQCVSSFFLVVVYFGCHLSCSLLTMSLSHKHNLYCLLNQIFISYRTTHRDLTHIHADSVLFHLHVMLLQMWFFLAAFVVLSMWTLFVYSFVVVFWLFYSSVWYLFVFMLASTLMIRR